MQQYKQYSISICHSKHCLGTCFQSNLNGFILFKSRLVLVSDRVMIFISYALGNNYMETTIWNFSAMSYQRCSSLGESTDHSVASCDIANTSLSYMHKIKFKCEGVASSSLKKIIILSLICFYSRHSKFDKDVFSSWESCGLLC